MIIHGYVPKRKKKKLTAKQRELKDNWEKILKKYEPKKAIVNKNYIKPLNNSVYRRETPDYPSLKTMGGDTNKRPKSTYTGTEMIGIGTLHKSNAVPIFRKEDALEQAQMRR